MSVFLACMRRSEETVVLLRTMGAPGSGGKFAACRVRSADNASIEETGKLKKVSRKKSSWLPEN
jgi:hypothetical protein